MRKPLFSLITAASMMLATSYGWAQALPQVEAFSTAVEQADTAKVRAFLQQEPRLALARTADGWPVFLQQAMFFTPEILSLFMANGADPNIRNSAGETLLHHLAEPESIRHLLAAGADIEARDHKGWTPLMSHATDETTGPDAIYTLLAEGADPSARGHRGETAATLLPQGKRFDQIRKAMLKKVQQKHP